MKQIDKLAWIEIKDKKYFPPEVLERTNTIFLVEREETDIEALTREIKEN
jgi:hypothetical protein